MLGDTIKRMERDRRKNNECIIVTDEDLEITLKAISEAMEEH